MNFLKRHWIPIVLALAIITSIVFSSESTPSQSPKTDSIEQANVIVNDTLAQCFLYEQETNIGTEELPDRGFNREYIEIAITDNGLVTGQHLILPYGSDNNRADFVGVFINDFINVVATASAQEQTWQEQRMYKIEDDRLYVGYQKIFVPRYQNENDIYLYEDINNIIFDTNEFYLSAVDCDEIDRSVL